MVLAEVSSEAKADELITIYDFTSDHEKNDFRYSKMPGIYEKMETFL